MPNQPQWSFWRQFWPVLVLWPLLTLSPIIHGAEGVRVLFIKGQALTLTSRDPRPLPLTKGQIVPEGNVIRTKDESLVILGLPNSSRLKLGENTSLRVTNLSPLLDSPSPPGESQGKAYFLLESGSVLVKAIKERLGDLQVKTTQVSMGVRGTEFFVAFAQTADAPSAPHLWMCVHEGAVEVQTSESKVLVPAGQGVLIKEGRQLTPPQNYPWTKKINWNTDPLEGDVGNQVELGESYDLLKHDYD